MIAISSFRPLSKCSPERQAQYVRAKRSWDKVFKQVHYFNALEPKLASDRTVFIARDDPDARPPISLLAEHASQQRGYVALINADIEVDERLAQAQVWFTKFNVRCALSRRLVSPIDVAPVDWGLDFFCALPEIWRAVACQVPQVFTLGRVRFDTWLCTFFSRCYPKECYDLTPSRLIYHAPHQEREDQFVADPPDYYLTHPAYPTRRLMF